MEDLIKAFMSSPIREASDANLYHAQDMLNVLEEVENNKFIAFITNIKVMRKCLEKEWDRRNSLRK